MERVANFKFQAMTKTFHFPPVTSSQVPWYPTCDSRNSRRPFRRGPVKSYNDPTRLYGDNLSLQRASSADYNMYTMILRTTINTSICQYKANEHSLDQHRLNARSSGHNRRIRLTPWRWLESSIRWRISGSSGSAESSKCRQQKRITIHLLPVYGRQMLLTLIIWRRLLDVAMIVHILIRYLSYLTPSTPAVPHCCRSKGTAPYWSNPPFLISDIRAIWRSGLSARAHECQKLKMVG